MRGRTFLVKHTPNKARYKTLTTPQDHRRACTSRVTVNEAVITALVSLHVSNCRGPKKVTKAKQNNAKQKESGGKHIHLYSETGFLLLENAKESLDISISNEERLLVRPGG